MAAFFYWYFQIKRLEKSTQPESEIVPEKEEEKPETLTVTKRLLSKGFSVPILPRKIDAIIIHSVYNSLGGDPYDPEKVIEKYEMEGVASHYLIDREGKIYHLVPEENIAHHAGTSQMPDGRKNVNNFSIGIELIYALLEGPNQKQYQALAQLLNHLRQKYEIPPNNILGHKDVSPNKTDPWEFDWQYLRSLLD